MAGAIKGALNNLPEDPRDDEDIDETIIDDEDGEYFDDDDYLTESAFEPQDDDIGFKWDYRSHAEETNAILGDVYESVMDFSNRFRDDESIPNGGLIALAIEMFGESLYNEHRLDPNVESERY